MEDTLPCLDLLEATPAILRGLMAEISEEDARNEDQLALYQIGLSQNPHYGAKEKFKLLWHFVAFKEDQVVSERSPKEIETLKKVNTDLISTIEETLKIQADGKVKRQQAEGELVRLENDLKDKLLSLKS